MTYFKYYPSMSLKKQMKATKKYHYGLVSGLRLEVMVFRIRSKCDNYITKFGTLSEKCISKYYIFVIFLVSFR
jgi:hypothetical protein